jgi:hypothetical protein
LSDIDSMEPNNRIEIPQVESKTRECPFCAETIQGRAIKCRHCGEFLDTERTRALLQFQKGNNQNVQPPTDGKGLRPGVLFMGRPSLFGMTEAILKGMIFIAIGIFLIRYPLEDLAIFQQQPNQQKVTNSKSSYEDKEIDKSVAVTEQQKEQFGRYRVMGGVVLILLVVCVLLAKGAELKATCYEVTADRIEWSRGLIGKKVDNIDMFRVIDIQLNKTMFDCIFAIGTVTIMTTDKSDPTFHFRKIRKCRALYEAIKTASIGADRRNNVMHLE